MGDQFVSDIAREMTKALSCVFLVVLGCSMVQGQSANINSTLNDIKNFQTSVVTTTSRGFNALFTEVYGHFFRSQTTLRVARQTVFTSISRFPLQTLSQDTRKNLTSSISTLIAENMDTTIDFLQKESMLRFFNYAKDESTPIERTLKVIDPQLQEISSAVSNTSDDTCLRRENINRRLPTEYNAIIAAINECTRNITAAYRTPINDFTRAHFVALPLIARLGADLMACANNAANRESCVVKFLETYCVNATNESCKTGQTISFVKVQAESMVNTIQGQYDECLKLAEGKIPEKTPFVSTLSSCVKSVPGNDNGQEEQIVEESDSINAVN